MSVGDITRHLSLCFISNSKKTMMISVPTYSPFNSCIISVSYNYWPSTSILLRSFIFSFNVFTAIGFGISAPNCSENKVTRSNRVERAQSAERRRKLKVKYRKQRHPHSFMPIISALRLIMTPLFDTIMFISEKMDPASTHEGIVVAGRLPGPDVGIKDWRNRSIQRVRPRSGWPGLYCFWLQFLRLWASLKEATPGAYASSDTRRTRLSCSFNWILSIWDEPPRRIYCGHEFFATTKDLDAFPSCE